MQVFNLKSVLRLTGLNPDTIRAWEKRYVAVKPKRTSTGRRMYSEQEVNRLKLLADLTHNGHSIGSVANLPDEKLIALLATVKSGTGVITSKQLNPQIPQITEDLLKAVENFDLGMIEIHMARANYTMSPRDLLFHLIPQLMYKVGDRVIEGKLGIGQEHALSELLKRYVRGVYDDLSPVDGAIHPDKTLVFATPENHLHEFGILMSAVLCRFYGFKTTFLGPNMPVDSLIAAAKQIKAHAIVLGFSPITLADSKAKPLSYLRELHIGVPQETMLWLGGAFPKISVNEFTRDIWKFESLEELDKKIETNYSTETNR